MQDDFSALERTVYSGRGIMVGATPLGNPFIAYSLTGRSPPSQARRLVYDPLKHIVKIEVTDPEQLAKGNPALLVYPAIMGSRHSMVASNGAQTTLLHNAAQTGLSEPEDVIKKAFAQPHLVEGIDITTFEPDDPNFTPRISAYADNKRGGFHVIKRGPEGQPIRLTQLFDTHNGRALGVTTYKGGNEKPLLPFEGDLLEYELSSCRPEEIAENLYTALRGKSPDDYRVAVAVMMIDMPTNAFKAHVVNRHGEGR